MLILRVWRSQPGKYFCLSTKSRSGEWKDHFFTRSTFSGIKAFIDANLDKDVYWCPHGFRKARRLKEFAEIPTLLWADLDNVRPENLELRPSIAWESSPGRFAALWRLTSAMDEDLNRRLTYAIGADPGGWDLTQVLRVPGTRNYKYEGTPKVRWCWMDGPEYEVAQIKAWLPAEATNGKSNVGLAHKLYRKYEAALPGWVRRQLLAKKAEVGKRSEVLWKLAHELLEAGATRDEAFEMLKASAWNKFAGRRREDEQLHRELEKALSQKLPEGVGDIDEWDDYRWLGRSMAEVKAEKIDWLWYPYLALGEVSILEGDPGLGKSYLAQMVSKAVCDGDVLPSPKPLKVHGKVVYFDIENSAAHVTKARLEDNGCKEMGNFFQEERAFSIDDEETTDAIFAALEEHRPKLVVFDTLNTYIGSVDTGQGARTQQAFKRFVEIARRFNCAVLVLRHLTKGGRDRAIYRGQGNIAISGLARIIMTVGEHPEDDEIRVLSMTKLNLARHPRSLAFGIESLPATVGRDDRSRFVWGEFNDLTSEDILAKRESGGGGEAMSDAVKFLEDFLEEGGVDASNVYTAAEARGISRRTLQRAATKLGVVKEGKVWSIDLASYSSPISKT